MFGCQGHNLICIRVSVEAGYSRAELLTFMLCTSRTPQRRFPVEQIGVIPELVVKLCIRVLERSSEQLLPIW